jgi:SAM-dependent methyltransferase
MPSLLDYVRRNARYALPHYWRRGAKAIYRRFSRNGILFAEDELGMASLHPSLKTARIVELVHPGSVVDVGCGTGATLQQFMEMGVEAIGVEASRAAIRASSMRTSIVRHDLRRPLDLKRRFDLAWCFEVAEHIHPMHVDIFVDSLCRLSDIVTLSAAPPGQGGEGHFNEQPQSYWSALFGRRGYALHENWTLQMQSVDEFYSENMRVFSVADPRVPP